MVESDKSKPKLKILLLHGFVQNPDIFESRIKAILSELRKHFTLDYSIPRAPYLIEKDKETSEDKLGWFYMNEEDKTDSSLLEKEELEYLGFDRSYSLIREHLKENKDYQVIFGFSQGSLFANFILSLWDSDKINELLPELKCVVLVANFIEPNPLNTLIKDPIKKALDTEKKVPLPSLHVYGEKDIFIPKEKSIRASEMYVKDQRELHEHPGKHFIPSKRGDLDTYIAFLRRYIK